MEREWAMTVILLVVMVLVTVNLVWQWKNECLVTPEDRRSGGTR